MDIETDGPVPGVNAVRNLPVVVIDDMGAETDALTLNLQPARGHHPGR